MQTRCFLVSVPITMQCHLRHSKSAQQATAEGDPGCRFNEELLTCVMRAWLEALRTLLQLDCGGVYGLLPPAADLQAAPDSLGFLLAQKVW